MTYRVSSQIPIVVKPYIHVKCISLIQWDRDYTNKQSLPLERILDDIPW